MISPALTGLHSSTHQPGEPVHCRSSNYERLFESVFSRDLHLYCIKLGFGRCCRLLLVTPTWDMDSSGLLSCAADHQHWTNIVGRHSAPHTLAKLLRLFPTLDTPFLVSDRRRFLGWGEDCAGHLLLTFCCGLIAVAGVLGGAREASNYALRILDCSALNSRARVVSAAVLAPAWPVPDTVRTSSISV